MNRRILPLVVALIAVGLIATIPLGAAMANGDVPAATVGGDDRQVEAENTTNASDVGGSADDLRPGERMSGVIGVQESEVEGELDSRSFEVRLAEADTDAERAAVIADRIERNEQRLTEIREQQRELRERRAAGNLSNGAYAARMAKTGATVESVKRTTNRSAAAAAELPDTVLAEQDVNAERIRALRSQSNELSGPETAAIARSIGGNRTGAPMGADRGERPESGIGPPPEAGNGSGPDGNGSGPDGNGSGPEGNGSGPDERGVGSEAGPDGNSDTDGNQTSRGPGAGDGQSANAGNTTGSDGGSNPGNASDADDGETGGSGAPADSGSNGGAGDGNDDGDGDPTGSSDADTGSDDADSSGDGGRGDGADSSGDDGRDSGDGGGSGGDDGRGDGADSSGDGGRDSGDGEMTDDDSETGSR